MLINDYRAEKEKKYRRMILDEHRLYPAQKITIPTETGSVDGYIYLPDNPGNYSLPVLFNLHGGGFVLGYCEQDAPYCRRLANEAHCAVINVDYSLAPEHKFPLPVISTYEFICGVLPGFENLGLDDSRIAIGGHSAGGNISAAITLLARDKGGPLFAGQILDYPPLDFADMKYDQLDSQDRMFQYMNWYFRSEKDRYDSLASPVQADLSHLPPALILSAGLDPLCKEAEVYAKKLASSGTPVHYHCFQNRMHGFTHSIFSQEYHCEDSDKAWTLMANFLRECFEK